MRTEKTGTEAREGENVRWQWRTLIVSTALITVGIFAIYFFVIANQPG